MKELDLTGARLLKLWLRMGYYDFQISGEKDICTLVRMCLKSGLCGVGYLFLCLFMLGMGTLCLCGVLIMLSFLTLYLPEAYYASADTIGFGYMLLCVISLVLLGGGVIDVAKGKMKFAPEYMKHPLRKLFKNSTPDTEETLVKEATPSKTWVAIKEMYLSVKDKTCIKVKL